MVSGKKEGMQGFKWFFIGDIPFLMPSRNVAKQIVVELWLGQTKIKIIKDGKAKELEFIRELRQERRFERKVNQRPRLSYIA